MHRFHLVFISLSAALAACTISDKPPVSADTPAAGDTISTGISDSGPPLVTIPANPPDSPTAAQPVAPPTGTWTVSETGIGPLRAGMTLAEANAALGGILRIPSRLAECDFVRPRSVPRHLALMVENDSISRVDVLDSSTIATTSGARIGDTEARIRGLYPGRITARPHKYTDGRYLVVTPANPADSAFRIVFETDGSKVLRYRSGIRPAVEYVEGCS